VTPLSTPVVSPRSYTGVVVRLRLLLEDEDGRRHEAVLFIPNERYDGVRVLELFEQHRMAGTTRVVNVTDAGTEEVL
jgi:hypothetical protein